MSNFLAIATVTEALRQLVNAGVHDDVANTDVTTQRPEAAGNGAQGPRVNIYLYRVSPNAALRNRDLPEWRRSGDQVQNRPVAALDLHYLFSFFGSEAALEPQRLLGSTVRTLHTYPAITREMLATVAASPTFPGFLTTSDLASQPELVKFTPAPLSLDDLSKLWSVFFQTPYALSVAYEATVVLIESEETAQTALPVLRRGLLVTPFRQPRIDTVRVKDAPADPIVLGSTLSIRGQQLQGELTRLRLDGDLIVPDTVSDTAIELTLTDPLPPADPAAPARSLRAGVHALQVVQYVRFPIPAEPPPAAPVQGDPHKGFESNVVPFVLHPVLTSVPAVNAAGDQITVPVAPDVREGQRATLLLNARPGTPLATYALALPPAASDTSTLGFPLAGVDSGDYFVRLQVDGAESAVQLDPAHPPLGPSVSVP